MTKLVVQSILKSPILRALIIFLFLFGVAFLLVPTMTMTQILDAFTIAGGVAVGVRFGKAAWQSLLRTDPRQEDVWLVGGVMVSFAIAVLRAFRLVGLESGMIALSDYPAYLYSGATVLLIFGMFMKVIAPDTWGRRLSPYAGITLAVISGLGVALAITLLRWVLGLATGAF